MDLFGMKWSMIVKDGSECGVVAGNEFVKICRWVSYEFGLGDVRNEVVNIDRINATERPKDSRLGWWWCTKCCMSL